MADATDLTPARAAGRTAVIGGFSVSGAIGLLQAFNVVHFTTDQVLYLAPFLTGAGAFLLRVVEARTGRGLLRTVDKPAQSG